jgi:F-type H+-transporting ATPase subunit a
VENKRKWRWGVGRWIVLGIIILNIIASGWYAPVLPHIQLPAEHITENPLFYWPWGEAFYFTNTMVAMLIADVLILLLALSVNRAATSGSLVPSGISGAVEAFLEVIYNLTESTAGKWVRQIFPFFATITLYVLIVNWMELIPGVDSVGVMHHVDHGGHAVVEVTPGIETVIPDEGGFVLLPWVRALSTDLNFTLALALISVISTQIMGVRALGIGYFQKFINVGGLFSRPIFGVIDFGVGLLELVSEISKILSFSFRLFGNIFAGMVLLFVIGTLVPVFAQSIFLLLEFFVGLIQAVVFGMLTMVFMAQATYGHGEHHEEHAEGVEEMPIEGPEHI